jgi:plasmid stabilization system protein ParE
MRVRFHAEAEAELEEASDFYDLDSESAAEAFEAEAERVVQSIPACAARDASSCADTRTRSTTWSARITSTFTPLPTSAVTGLLARPNERRMIQIGS